MFRVIVLNHQQVSQSDHNRFDQIQNQFLISRITAKLGEILKNGIAYWVAYINRIYIRNYTGQFFDETL